MATTARPAEPVGTDLLRLLKTLKLGALADTGTDPADLRASVLRRVGRAA
mgnify:CR=1 FL=1